MKKLVIFTPAYNRANLLDRLYNSLVKQTNKDFTWFIVDDGSQDNTEEVVNSFIKENKIDIVYKKKENGGKHTAINYGLSFLTNEIFAIVDSDDYLTEDAIETIFKDWKDIEDREDVCGIAYLRSYIDGKNIGQFYTEDEIIENFITQRYNKGVAGDKFEVVKADVLKKFPFPEFQGERFLSEAVVWCKMSGEYKFKFLNKGIYLCEYQEGGLTANVHKALFNNPKGATECYKVLSTKQFSFKNRIKFTMLYSIHSWRAYGLKQTLKNANSKFLYLLLLPFSWVLYLKRKRKANK